MRRVGIRQVRVEAGPANVSRAARLARRAAELLGEQLASGDAVQPRRKLVVEVAQQPGWAEESMARLIARHLRSRLG